MATKKYRCKVCGYIYEGAEPPATCPKCGAPASEFEEVKEKGIDTNSNSYTIIYASLVVVIVAFLLAFVSKALQPQSDANVAIDKKSQILAALNIRNLPKSEVEKKYKDVIKMDEVINSDGDVVKPGTGQDKDGFKVSTKEITPQNMPLYVCEVNGLKYYVIPLSGRGLWGGIWGFVSLKADKQTIYGAYFSHESETAGLGARITEYEGFQKQFENKKISDESGKIILCVVKKGKEPQGVPSTSVCDGITGATLTSNGVNAMLHDCLTQYKSFLMTNE